MKTGFRFGRIPLILYRSGEVSELPSIIRRYGDNIILVTGKSSFIKSIQGELLLNDLKTGGFRYKHIIVESEPSPRLIDHAVSECRNPEPDAVVAIGGGSVIDAGKAISAMLTVSLPVKAYLEGIGTMEHPGEKIKFIAVPTTSGTGSEATKNAVISETGPDGFKRSLRHDNFIPDVAVVDPELTISCPPELTASSGMDCFTQLTEAYLSDKSNKYTDALALEAMGHVKSSLVKCFTNGLDLEARESMSFAALTSGICLSNAGLGVVHGFASSIGGRYNIPHGLICGTLMAAANEMTVRALRRDYANFSALRKYARLGKLFIGKGRRSDAYYIDGFIDYLYKLTADLKLKGLKETGVNENELKDICASTECKNNPVKLDSEYLLEIITKRFI